MNEQQKIENLMKPRYKLIMDYPGNGRPIGFIWTMDKKDSEGWYTTTGYLQETFFTMYPDIFKKLEWWEYRTPEEMPEYYKYSGTHGVYKTQFQANGNIIMLDFKPAETVPCKLSDCSPATESEYLSYTQQPQPSHHVQRRLFKPLLP